jgi:predicted MFS family arabinose efflux permease
VTGTPPPPDGAPGGHGAPPGLRANRYFAFYLGGTTATWAGMGIADVLLLWLVFFDTGSTLAVAAVGLAEAVPPIAFGFLAGLLADRTDRRRLLIVTALLQAAVLALVPLTLWAFGFRLGLVLALVLVLETVTVASQPSSTAVLPSLVDSDSLDAANALSQGFISVATTLGAAVAAVLLVVLGTSTSFGLNAGLFALAAILLSLVVLPRTGPTGGGTSEAPRPLRQDLVDVVRFLRGHPWLLDLTLVSVAAGFFVMMFSPYLVVYTVRILRMPASDFGFLAAGYGAGFFVGSLLTPRLRLVRSFGWFFVLALVGSGALLGFLVLVPYFVPALVALGALGILMGMVLTGFVTLAQRAVPRELLGRYLGLEQSLAWAVAPLGILAGGLVTQLYGIREGFAIAGIGLGIVGIIALSSRRVRAAGYVPGAPAAAYSVPPGALLSAGPRPPLEP